MSRLKSNMAFNAIRGMSRETKTMLPLAGGIAGAMVGGALSPNEGKAKMADIQRAALIGGVAGALPIASMLAPEAYKMWKAGDRIGAVLHFGELFE